jgi:hypothetical protein
LKSSQLVLGLILIYLFLSCFNAAYAQQTVFTVPSADITPKGKLLIEQESQFRPWKPGAFWNGTIYAMYGVGHNTEACLTLFNVSSPPSNNVTLGTGFKSAIPIPGLKEKYPAREFKFTVGSEVLASLENRSAGNWSYATLSGRTPVTNTRLTAGISVGTKDIFGVNTTSFITAVEHPVTKKLTIIADWYSGQEHFAGFLISGIHYLLPKDMELYAGYQIPNSSRNGKSGFVLELAKTF